MRLFVMTALFGLFGLILSSCFSFVPARGTVKESFNRCNVVKTEIRLWVLLV